MAQLKTFYSDGLSKSVAHLIKYGEKDDYKEK
jgi:hypothetical protein